MIPALKIPNSIISIISLIFAPGQHCPQVKNQTNLGGIIGDIRKFERLKGPVWEL